MHHRLVVVPFHRCARFDWLWLTSALLAGELVQKHLPVLVAMEREQSNGSLAIESAEEAFASVLSPSTAVSDLVTVPMQCSGFSPRASHTITMRQLACSIMYLDEGFMSNVRAGGLVAFSLAASVCGPGRHG